MKQYLLFEWNDREQLGGYNDFRGDYDSFDEALTAAIKANKGTSQIIDSHAELGKRILLMGQVNP